MRVVTVLQTKALHALQRGSSEYTPAHVVALRKQLEAHAPFVEFECLSDVDVPGVKTRRLRHNWPGWWAKMNLFDPTLPGDFLFMDLDTVIVGSLDDVLSVRKLTVLRDFYRDGVKLKEGLGGGLIYLPAESRSVVWDYFTANPTLAMRLAGYKGDMEILERFYRGTADRWQDVLPGQVVSWKVHCRNGIPPGARIVCGHGKPRPWEVPQFLHLYR